ncbi:MAG: hypothetical protein LBU53_10220 [Zoogloeaceae bacterium]|jgi:hypothetical protein|nr:hypothetical protein [Zoogloeaceae bacterium]
MNWVWAALGALGFVLLMLAYELIVQLVFGPIFFGVGWGFLRLITFGRYPPENGEYNVEGVVVAGFFVLTVIAVIAYFLGFIA